MADLLSVREIREQLAQDRRDGYRTTLVPLGEAEALLDAVELAGDLPIGVPEARLDDLRRLDRLHQELGVLPAGPEVSDG